MITGVAARVIVGLADFYTMVIFIYVMLSWFPHSYGAMGDIYRVLGTICEPYLKIFRAIIPPVGGVDFSPIIAFVVLQLIVRLLV
ncbi:MAG: YggT family protein [Coriobacteriales bacterium]|nr:YggT family protein [Coriobacteriales bacterium]